ncbi:hypothetical protein ASC82_07905 [Streptomyces sp. Root431]|nr:hypothetical protein ASC82_07905 [Streptomyces sp. Root431]
MDAGGEQGFVPRDPLGRAGLALLGRVGVLPHHRVRLCMRVVSFRLSLSVLCLLVVPCLFSFLFLYVSLLISYHQSPPGRWWHEEPPRGGIRAMSVG